MSSLQATWLPERALFFWVEEGALSDVLAAELPELLALGTLASERLVDPHNRRQSCMIAGRKVPLAPLLALLPALDADVLLADSVRFWSLAARLGLELASRQAVAPVVYEGCARWSMRLQRREDRDRFEQLVASMPVVCRVSTVERSGPPKIRSAFETARTFLDAVADLLYRNANAWPGPSRGWARELAEALKGDDPSFNPRDARSQGMPDRLHAWVSGAEHGGIGLGILLQLPARKASNFPVEFCLISSNPPYARVSLATAWQGGDGIELAGRHIEHPAWLVLRRLARAVRVFPPLAPALSGDTPSNLVLDAHQAWALISQGARALTDAGFEVELPEVFGVEGARRIRARMRIEVGGAEGSPLHLGEDLTFRWEVVLGERVLTGEEFASVAHHKEPILHFAGEWTLLDPAEIAKLPKGLSETGTLDAATALRAVLTGQHEGVPVVADDRLGLVVDALRHPPARALPAGLQAVLRPYQADGFAWLACLGDLGLGACLADDMGLGKTVQLISHLLDRHAQSTHRLPSLVVCPTSLLGNWTREIRRFAPSLTVARHHGNVRNLDRARRADVVLTTYGLLAREHALFQACEWEIAALDEAQAIKNPESRRAQAAYDLKARHKVALSGTPVENRLDELWSIMHFLIPGLLGSRSNFRRNVAIPVERFGDEEVALRLRLGVSPFLLRRVKTDPIIRGELPDKIERREYSTLTQEQAALYREVAESHLERVQSASASARRGQILAMLTALKQVCNHPAHYLGQPGPLAGRSGKLERVMELLEAILEAGEHAIIFTQYREMGERLTRHIAQTLSIPVPFLHGGVEPDERDAMVQAFQREDGPPVFVLSLRAGGTGLNLTRATHVIHFDRWWNPAVEDQATDRAYRLGQHDNVQVYKLVCQGTLEERIDQMLEDKRALAQSVVGGGERLVADLDDAALRALVALGDDAVLEDS